MALAITNKKIEKDILLFAYDNLDEADASPASLEFPELGEISVQVIGSFGAGGTVLIEGSNDGINYGTLTDPQGVALSLTAAGIKSVQQITRHIRPRVSAGTSVDVDVFFLLRKKA